MSTKSPVVWDLIRFYDPVVKRHVPLKRAQEYSDRRDPDILDLPPDAKPIIFRCKALTMAQRDTLDLLSTEKHRWKIAFRMALLEIRDPSLPGGAWKPSRAEIDEPLDDDAMAAVYGHGFGDDDVLEIGSAVEALSRVGKGVPPHCPRLVSSARSWDIQSSSRRAAPNTDDETPTE